jgi:hypothetical protein
MKKCKKCGKFILIYRFFHSFTITNRTSYKLNHNYNTYNSVKEIIVRNNYFIIQ